MQTEQEVNFIFAYWFENLAPKGLLDTVENGQQFHDEIRRRGFTHLSFENITEMCKALGDKLAYGGSPAPPTRAQVEAPKAEWKRGPRPDNKVDVNEERQRFVKDLYDINTPLFAKTQDEARIELDRAIERASTTYTRSGKLDHSLTAFRREQLRNIKVVHPEKSAKGQEVILYTEMLAEVQRMAKEYDREDARRNDQVR